MFQPEALKTEDYLPWSRGRGHDVWAALDAAARGDLARLQSLVAGDPALATCEFQYRTPLHFALRENRAAVVRFLLDRGADPTDYYYCLNWRPGNLDKGDAARLVAAHLRYDPAASEIAELIRARDVAQVRERLTADPSLVHRADHRGNRPLHWAALTRQLELIDLSLNLGAPIDAMRPDGARAVHLCAGDYWFRGGNLAAEAIPSPRTVFDYFIAHGAEYDISLAAKAGDIEHVRSLLDQDPSSVNRLPTYCTYSNGPPLRNAAGLGYLSIVQLLLERGANPNLAENNAPFGGALLDSIGEGHCDVARLLLEHGADANGAVESSGNCLWRARNANAPQDIIDILVSRGAKIPLDIAAYDGDVELAKEILGDKPVPEDAFRQAVVEGQRGFVEFLLAREPAVMSRFSFDGAPTLEFARWLLEKGQDPKPFNWLGTTALHRFAGDGNLEMAKLCLQYGADANAIDEEFGLTPLGWAQRSNQVTLIKLLS